MKDYTDITFILDRSGSMQYIREATIKGFNGFVEDQRSTPGEGCWTLVQFDVPQTGEAFPEFVFTAIPQRECPPLTKETFVPRGGTALIQAVCETIDKTGKRLARLPESDRPDKVLIVIMTDGQENSSAPGYTSEELRGKILHQKEKYNWKFVFLGANQDAIAEASRYGLERHSAMTYDATSKGTDQVYTSVSRATRAWKLDGNGSAGPLMGTDDPDVTVNVTVNTQSK